MSTDFSSEMNALSQELVALKIQKPQPPSVLITYTTEVNITFNMELYYDFTIKNTRSDMFCIIDYGVTNNPLANAYLDINGTEGRKIMNIPYIDENSGNIGRMIYIYQGNDNDETILDNGGSVTINFKVVITSTEEITPTVTYKDLWTN